MKRLFLGLVLVIALQACSKKITTDTVANTKWTLSEWTGQTLPTKEKATLNFGADNQIGGKSFCNTFGGRSTISGNTIKIEEVFGTMMFCESVAEAERNYTEGLKTVNSFKVVDGKLQLLKDGKVMMVFTKGE